MNNQIILRIPLDRPPTEMDRWELIGADKFNQRLMAAGWTDENNTVLQPFRIEHAGHTENGEFYIQWTATRI